VTAPKLTAPAVSAAVRRAIGAGKAKAQTRDQIEVEGQLVTVSVWVTVHAGEDAARLAAGELLRAGYEVARTGTILTVVLPEPVEEIAEAAEASAVQPLAKDGMPPIGDPRWALAAQRQVAIGEVAHMTPTAAAEVLAATPAPAARISTREELIARQVSAGVAPERAAMIADARDRLQAELTANAPALAAALDDDEEDGTDGLVHLMSDALLDACGTARHGGGLHLAPSSTPERITCPRCLLYAVDEEVQRLGYRNAAHYLNGRPELRARVEVAADAPDSTAPIPVDLGEADVPPTAEERVEVAIRARELRPGDLVAGPTGYVAHAAFDVQLVDEPGEPVVVRVWTAIRDQERGLPPVVQYNAEREVRVLRPLSEEGRELLAALDRA
jgi:hypothetical protein